MLQVATRTRKSIESSETSIWLAYDRTGFTVIGNPSKSSTSLQGSPKRPRGNASAYLQKCREANATACSIVETLDYYPYGGIRIDNTTSSYSGNSRKYTGQIFDQATQLTYDNARYYNGTQGQFISQDPVFLGTPNQQILVDPQSLNAYSYSEDNPIVKSDPTGRFFGLDDAAEAFLLDLGIQAARAYLVNVGIGLLTASTENAVPSNLNQPSQINNNSTLAVSPYASVPFTGQDYMNIAGGSILPSLAAPIGGEAAEGLLGPGKRIIGSAIGIGAATVVNGEVTQPYTGQSQAQIFAGAGVNAAASYAANQIVGSVPGRDVQSLNANFLTGAHMQNEIQTGAVSQGLMSTVGQSAQSTLSSLLGQLSSALSALSATLSVHSAK